jgi:hypothetical protein
MLITDDTAQAGRNHQLLHLLKLSRGHQCCLFDQLLHHADHPCSTPAPLVALNGTSVATGQTEACSCFHYSEAGSCQTAASFQNSESQSTRL